MSQGCLPQIPGGVSTSGAGVSTSGPGEGVVEPLGRHPTGQTHSPRTDTLWADTPLQCMLGYGQQVVGTHPTGMHSCLFISESFLIKFCIIVYTKSLVNVPFLRVLSH